jgi:NAD(P)-dependent dehydrogenase (short-subunit alcohol dehydrogenase family)
MTALSGKVALATGASSGLGAATAKEFAEVFADVPGGRYASVDIGS